MANQPTPRQTGPQINLGMGLHLNVGVSFDRETQRVTLDLEIHHQFLRHIVAPLYHQVHQLNLAVDVDGANNRSGQEVILQRELPRLSLQANANPEISLDQNRDLQDSRSPVLASPVILPTASPTSAEGDDEINAPLGSPAVRETHFEPRTLQTTANTTSEPATPLSTITTADEVFEYIKSLPSPSLTDLSADCGTCHICLEPINFVKLPCGHHFGAECIAKWLTPTEDAQNNTCPICRAVLFETDVPDVPRRVRELERLLDLGDLTGVNSQFNMELMDIVRQDVEMRVRLAEVDYLYDGESEEWRLGTDRALMEDDAIEARLGDLRVRHRATIESLEGTGTSHMA